MDIARLYRDAQRSFVEFAQTLTDDEWVRHVPCTPEWTVHDVVSHVAGIADDVLNGRVDGAATDPWTAVQVKRWKGTPRDELIAQWNEQTGPVAEAFAAFGEQKPPFDCHMHEHDIRHAVGRPGSRDHEVIGVMIDRFAGSSAVRPVEISFVDGTVVTLGPVNGAIGETDGDPLRLTDVSQFDVVRSRLGRRSRRQVERWTWSEPPGTVLDEWFMFGPSALDIDE